MRFPGTFPHGITAVFLLLCNNFPVTTKDDSSVVVILVTVDRFRFIARRNDLSDVNDNISAGGTSCT